jgi:hypothetical protein
VSIDSDATDEDTLLSSSEVNEPTDVVEGNKRLQGGVGTDFSEIGNTVGVTNNQTSNDPHEQ